MEDSVEMSLIRKSRDEDSFLRDQKRESSDVFDLLGPFHRLSIQHSSSIYLFSIIALDSNVTLIFLPHFLTPT